MPLVELRKGPGWARRRLGVQWNASEALGQEVVILAVIDIAGNLYIGTLPAIIGWIISQSGRFRRDGLMLVINLKRPDDPLASQALSVGDNCRHIPVKNRVVGSP